MYALVALIAVAIALLVFSRSREHLEIVPTKIIADETESESVRTFNMAPSQMKTAYVAFMQSPEAGALQFPAWATTPEKKAAYMVRTPVVAFLRSVYTPATIPITDSDIATFVQQQIATLQAASPPPPLVVLTNYQNGGMTTLLKAYFIGQVTEATVDETSTTPPPITPPSNLPTAPGDFGQAVEIFRSNYVQYRTTGSSTYKQAYEGAEQWINRYLTSVQGQLTASNTNLTNFVDDYKNANPEMTILQKQLKNITKEGPRAQDEYQTVKRVMEGAPETIDPRNYYVKGAIIVGILGIAGVLSAR